MAKKVYKQPTCEILKWTIDILTFSEEDGVIFDAESIWWTTE